MSGSPVPDGSVIITPTEMFKELRETHDEVKALGPRIDSLADTIRATADDHETRIRALERARWVQLGGASVAATVFSVLANILLR